MFSDELSVGITLTLDVSSFSLDMTFVVALMIFFSLRYWG